MSRLPLVQNPTHAGTRDTLDRIQRAFGATPNMFRAVANSPAALASMWGSFGALSTGTLGAAIGERIAIAVANRNACEYCLAAHTAIGGKAGVNAAELASARDGVSADPKAEAAMRFALRLVDGRGQVSDADFATLRAAGFTDAEIVEVVAHVALNLFTNYVNIAFDVPVDFPAVPLQRAA
ncbi:carboxymuconolactone decarboxylase family protein [Piscinibacter gummiphilus]|uniref:Carboxymuconolactone decarboxylase n=1 Tax=Piscinibacter gummiphilus TaxID=946333 RepID=A0A1W6L3B9_9BURK|nr:peroxidase-related enzyme [Piscinibacter gummiphilus]ARN18781.1 carboxymuconolactone decarboxylase [Piscinibacter gummiphilus]ATU63423.1 carboxymuconolactone decarboxylase [Piscinibacter gummiphilus]GLS95936.1 alkyl hydroperoxide reductase AhpD [Piscinibacter gummiphilus]